MSGQYVVQPVLSADIEDVATLYFTSLIAPTPVSTKLPVPANDQDTVNGFLRIEAGPATLFGFAAWDQSFLMHAYSPHEAEAADISRNALAYAVAAQQQTVAGWYIVSVPTVVGGVRMKDPNVDLVRYRSAVTWRIAGHPI